MINNKKSLYDILIKYDSDSSMVSFCDSLSRVIQETHTESDLIRIISFSSVIDTNDIQSIDTNVGITEIIF